MPNGRLTGNYESDRFTTILLLLAMHSALTDKQRNTGDARSARGLTSRSFLICNASKRENRKPWVG